MKTDDLLRLLRRHQGVINASFTPDEFARYQDAVRALRTAGSDVRAVRIALRRVRVSLDPLPPGSELYRRLTQFRTAGTTSVLPDADELAALLRLLDSVEWPSLADASAELFRELRRELLAVPARGSDRLDPVSAADPVAAGLIRLTGTDGREQYPDFQFAPDTGDPLPVVQHVNRMILADQDPWGAAGWWLGRSVQLAGVPAELLGRVPDDTLTAAARALTDGGEVAW
ncbi:hypothetical protein [Streptomyces yaizuensis]|uniref:Uncharacterized protein n=1 Tax=Streptomyces yaizuensis TaxID=2989713 RepID=A0ABQ5P1W1_9ACTN|nr:hypothetical protein [Streptomyces sp. YSPA8]GLF96584.1 hypothetical protein SYYSPA8_19825 [Streptomyces sp. YSPA8]